MGRLCLPTTHCLDLVGSAVLYLMGSAEMVELNAAFLINCIECPIHCSTARSLPICILSFIGSTFPSPLRCIGSRLIFLVFVCIRLGSSSLFSVSNIAVVDNCRIHRCFLDIISRLCRTNDPVKKRCGRS